MGPLDARRRCTASPPPWFNRVRYFGVLSSHSKHRREVVPKATLPGRSQPEPAIGDQLSLEMLFDEIMKSASLSGGAMRWTEVATKKDAIARLLAKHGLAPQPPPKPTRHLVPLGQLGLPFSK